MEMEFVTESQDYSVAEFYEQFHTQLPVVVQVNQGFQGHIIEDTFGKGEILYIAAISKQERVVAKVHTGKCCRVLSIPKAFNENLCIIRHGRPGNEHSLSDILKHHRLPLKVQYPPNEIIIMGNKCFSSNEMPHMELVKTFEEIYLLGNYLTDGRLGKDVLHVPLYLPQLRLCRVTGIKRLKDVGWIKHCDTLKEESRHMEYDRRFGNLYVAEYVPSSIRPRMKYAYAEPFMYDTFINLVMHWPEFHFGRSPSKSSAAETKDESDVKTKTEQNNDKVKMNSQQEALTKVTIQSTIQTDGHYTDLITDDEIRRKEQFYTEINTQENLHETKEFPDVYEDIEISISKEDTTQYLDMSAFGILKEKEENVTDRHPPELENSEQSLKLNVRPVQSKAIPSNIKIVSHVSCKKVETDKKNDTDSYVTLIPDRTTSSVSQNPEEHIYVNNIPSTMVAPVVNLNQTLKCSVDQPLKHSQFLYRNDSRTDQNISHEQVNLGKDAISELTVQEVSEYLGKLNLEQYKENFTEHKIDGALLAVLDKEIFVQEFGMKELEALRLVKFAKEGRLPKCT